MGLDHGRLRTMGTDAIVFLAKCFLNRGSSLYHLRYEQQDFQRFILSFSNLSHPLATRSLQTVHYPGESRVNLSALQYHLSYFAPIEAAGIPTPSLETGGLVLDRPFFKIRRASHHTVHPPSRGEYPDEEQHFVERVFSISLMTYGQLGTFQLVVLGDIGANVNMNTFQGWALEPNENPLGLECDSLGTAVGLSQFLIALAWLVQTWNQGWNDTLDAIDEIVGFHVSSAL